jgi:hypothetical protein
VEVKDGDDTAREIFDGHYSRRKYRDGRSPLLFVGPGRKIVLVTHDATALFIWRKFIDNCIDVRTGERQNGVNCSVFRREGGLQASDLILAAEVFARRDFPGERLYTYVDANKTRRKRDPGRCFVRAGWRRCGRTKGGLIILEKL